MNGYESVNESVYSALSTQSKVEKHNIRTSPWEDVLLNAYPPVEMILPVLESTFIVGRCFDLRSSLSSELIILKPVSSSSVTPMTPVYLYPSFLCANKGCETIWLPFPLALLSGSPLVFNHTNDANLQIKQQEAKRAWQTWMRTFWNGHWEKSKHQTKILK